MTETVSDVIALRSRSAEKLSPALVWSVAAHTALLLVLVYGAARWGTPLETRTVMTISLGGSPGPDTGGMTPIGGRAVQAPAPAEPVRRAEPPPAANAPDMALPTRTPRTAPRRPPVADAPRDATGRTAATGDVPREGTARADTTVRGQGFGLSSGGGGGSGVQLDVGNFCCPEYIEAMVRAIQQNWRSNQGVVGTIQVRFTILRAGVVQPDTVLLERGSGFAVHEQEARSALLRAQLPPLPAQFPNPTLTVHMTFNYQR